jgi:hypothetical protein
MWPAKNDFEELKKLSKKTIHPSLTEKGMKNPGCVQK